MSSYLQKLCLLCLTLAFSTASLSAQSWVVENLYGGTDDEQAFDLISHADGSVTHIGYTYSLGNPGTIPNVHVVHSDPLGNPLWEQTYEMPVATPASAGIPYTGMAIIQTNNGEYIWTAGVHTTDPANSDIMVCRTNSVGNVIWSVTIGANGTDEVPTSIIEDPNTSEIYLAGYSNSGLGQGQDDALVAKLTSTGTSIWQSLFGGINNERAHDLILAANGYLLICGESNSYNSTYVGTIFRVFNTGLLAGKLAWGRWYGLNSPSDERLFSLMQHPGGDLYACGTRLAGGAEDAYAICASSMNGALLHTSVYSVTPSGSERAWHITSAANPENVIMTGQAPGIIGGSTDGFMLEVAPDLVALNYRLYGTPYDDVLRCIEYTPGNFSSYPTDAGYWMIGYNDANGDENEHLLRSNLVGKTGCDVEEKVFKTPITTSNSHTPTRAAYTPAMPFNVDDIPAGSFMNWCSGQYVGTYAAKTGPDVNSSVNTAAALNIELSPQPLTIGAEATLNFTLDSDAELEVVLHDMRGRQVFTLPYSAVAGANSVSFKPAGLSSGAYVLRLKGLAESQTLNLILLD